MVSIQDYINGSVEQNRAPRTVYPEARDITHHEMNSSVLLRKEYPMYWMVHLSDGIGTATSLGRRCGGNGPLSSVIIRNKFQNLQKLKCKRAVEMYKEM